ncbi:MAG: hypothetical protein ACLFSJ_04805 [Halorhodospira sp.]
MTQAMWGTALVPQDAEQQRAERRAVALQALGLGAWSYDLRQGRLEWDDRYRAPPTGQGEGRPDVG